jgi:hypothetical protein
LSLNPQTKRGLNGIIIPLLLSFGVNRVLRSKNVYNHGFFGCEISLLDDPKKLQLLQQGPNLAYFEEKKKVEFAI